MARNIIPSALFKVSIDDTWAGLGSNDNDDVRSFEFSPEMGLSAGYTLQGRSDLDQTKWYQGPLLGSVNMVYDHDDDAAGELAHWEAGDLRFLRLLAEFNANRSMQIDVCSRYITSPDVLAQEGRQHTLNLIGEIRGDDQPTPNIMAGRRRERSLGLVIQASPSHAIRDGRSTPDEPNRAVTRQA